MTQEDNNDALFSVEWSEVDMKLITTSGDHAVGLWNLQDNCALTKLNSFNAHRCTVKTACFKPQSSGSSTAFLQPRRIGLSASYHGLKKLCG